MDQFRRDGYAQFPQTVSQTLVKTARDRILRDIKENYDPNRLVEYNNQSWCPGLRGSPEILSLFKNRPVQSLVNDLLGKNCFQSDRGQIAIRKAHNSDQPYEPVPHIDGIPTPHNGLRGTEIQNFTALAGIFLTEVKTAFAGNFTVWPGSHLVLEKHFRERGKAALQEGMPAIPLGEPLQLLAKPGDLVLCHYELAHSAAPNVSDDDRIAIFFRLWFKEIVDPEAKEQRWHNLTHIWHDWPRPVARALVTAAPRLVSALRLRTPARLDQFVARPPVLVPPQ
jgi:ectoine hydroxylase-related dioxygenase (phytanoyl-CoA dioxygenase family)